MSLKLTRSNIERGKEGGGELARIDVYIVDLSGKEF